MIKDRVLIFITRVCVSTDEELKMMILDSLDTLKSHRWRCSRIERLKGFLWSIIWCEENDIRWIIRNLAMSYEDGFLGVETLLWGQHSKYRCKSLSLISTHESFRSRVKFLYVSGFLTRIVNVIWELKIDTLLLSNML